MYYCAINKTVSIVYMYSLYTTASWGWPICNVWFSSSFPESFLSMAWWMYNCLSNRLGCLINLLYIVYQSCSSRIPQARLPVPRDCCHWDLLIHIMFVKPEMILMTHPDFSGQTKASQDPIIPCIDILIYLTAAVEKWETVCVCAAGIIDTYIYMNAPAERGGEVITVC